MLDPPVKIQQARTVIKDKFCRPCQPVIEKLFCRIRSGIQVLRICLRHGWPVKIPFFQWFMDITVKHFSISEEKPVFRTVGRCTEMNSPLFCFLFQFPEDIPFRSHIDRVPLGKITPVHLKSIMMFRYRKHITGSCRLKQFHPLRRAKMFCPKHRNKILIPEVFLQSISFSVMLICRHSFFVHVARIPLIGICRNTVNTPVYKNTKFFFRQPLRHLRFTQRCP